MSIFQTRIINILISLAIPTGNRIDYVGSRMHNHNNISYSFNNMMLDLGLQDRGFTKYGLKQTTNVHEVIYEGMSFAEVQTKKWLYHGMSNANLTAKSKGIYEWSYI